MSNREDLDITRSGEVAISSIIPILERLENQLGYVCSRVEEFIPRRHIHETVKHRHRSILKLLGGRCPCCGLVSVLDASGEVIGAEYDHFYSRERNALEDTWLICKACHRNMKDRVKYTDQFRVYQQRVVAMEGGQLSLI